MKITIPYRGTVEVEVNPAPSPFHFAYFFQNVNIGHGGLLPTIRAHQITRSGDAYQKPLPHPLVANLTGYTDQSRDWQRHYGAVGGRGRGMWKVPK